MSGQAKAVMWIGLFLIGMNIIVNWHEIRDLIFTGPASTPGGGIGGIIGNLLPGSSMLRSNK